MLVSIVVPFYNEAGNVEALHRQITEVVGSLPGHTFEFLYVNDGSTDTTRDLINRVASADDRVRAIHLRRNSGQSGAVYSGLTASLGEYILTLDGDLQNDPVDIPAFIELLHDYDCVCGYRENRNDSAWRRTGSRIANRVRNAVLRDGVRDSACGAKGFRRSCIPHLVPFNGLHRFMPALLLTAGMSVTEYPVRHHPRRHGKSKYRTRDRFWRGIYDLIGVMWWRRRYVHPVPESDPED